MQNVCFRAMTLATAVAGILFLPSRAPAQMVTTLVNFDATWRYDASGTELGTEWRTNTFNDTAWSSGQGILGLETTPNVYPVPFRTTLTVPTPITHYFRIHFNFAGATNGVTLVASNLVDDGCVVYLNGREAGRLRVPAGQNSTTQASGGPATEGAIEVMTFPSGLLRQGDNVLAVEVHQSGTTSSDVAWATRLVAIIPTMLSITAQPQSQTVALGGSASFSVGVSGGPVTYYWQKETSPGSGAYNTISGVNSNMYTINNVQVSHAGNYRVIASNAVNSVTSAVAALTVTADTIPPRMLSAIVREVITGPSTNAVTNFTQIDLTFDESVSLATATNLGNYVLKRFETGAVIPLERAQHNNTLVRLTVASNAPGWIYRANYYLTVNNVADTRGNPIAPGSTIGVSWLILTNVLQMGQTWDFFDSAFISTEPYVNNNFARTNYAISPGLWGNGPGILSFGINNQNIGCAGDTLQTVVSFQLEPTLFRRTFNIATNLSRQGRLRLRYLVDDGAVFFLNGQPIHHYNVANTVSLIATNTRAASNIGDPTCITNVQVNVTNLFPGMNWIAAAVCQGTANNGDGDTAFGLEMDLEYPLTSPAPEPPPPPPHLFIARSGTNATITWTNAPGYVLESSTTFGGSGANAWLTNWAAVPGAASPYSAPVGTPPRFYRLRK